MQTLYHTLNELIAASGANVAVAMQTLDEKNALFINAGTIFHAASTMKIAVMLELFHQVEQGKIRLDDRLPIEKEFPSIVDGSLYVQEREYEQEKPLYAAADMSVYDLCHLMITLSSNLATNVLMRRLGQEAVQAMLRASGINGMTIIRYLEDNKAFALNMHNNTDAHSLLQLLMGIGQRRILSAGSCDTMLDILKQQIHVNRIPAGLPPGTVVAHKTGEITAHAHDAGIIYAPRPFVLVVLTRGITEHDRAAALIASIAKAAYEALN